MIGQLRGLCLWKTDDSALIDVGGVGYIVFCSGRTLDQIEANQAELVLKIETHVREDHIHLYGFIDQEERQAFKLLSTVQGVGARMALSILTSFAPSELFSAINAEDSPTLTKASGVGPKLATRIVTELKGKMPQFLAFSQTHSMSTVKASSYQGSILSPVAHDAISALVNLGYRRFEAQQAVAKILTRETQGGSLNDLIKASLAELAP